MCFEVIGRPDTYFNFITDQCTSVNVLYSSIPSDFPAGFNVITKIGISAIDTATECVFIDIGTNNSCNPIIYNANLNSAEAPYNRNGISAVQRRTHVRISVPNCGNSRLVMYVTCENGSVPMLRFDVTRCINLSPTSHGILGEFSCVKLLLYCVLVDIHNYWQQECIITLCGGMTKYQML